MLQRSILVQNPVCIYTQWPTVVILVPTFYSYLIKILHTRVTVHIIYVCNVTNITHVWVCTTNLDGLHSGAEE